MSDLYMISGMTAALGSAGLGAGTTAGTIKIAAPNGAGLDYAINGFAYHKADTDNIALTATANLVALSSAMFLVQINAAGTVALKQGRQVLNTAVGSTQSLQWPAPDDGWCPIGGMKVTVRNAATFLSGTTSLAATDVAKTFYNFALGMPETPETSLAV